jgi:hypothetical protein
MRGGGRGKMGGRGARGDDSYNIQSCTLIDHDHGSHHCHKAVMGHHSRLLRIQQLTNILCDRTTWLTLE